MTSICQSFQDIATCRNQQEKLDLKTVSVMKVQKIQTDAKKKYNTRKLEVVHKEVGDYMTRCALPRRSLKLIIISHSVTHEGRYRAARATNKVSPIPSSTWGSRGMKFLAPLGTFVWSFRRWPAFAVCRCQRPWSLISSTPSRRPALCLPSKLHTLVATCLPPEWWFKISDMLTCVEKNVLWETAVAFVACWNLHLDLSPLSHFAPYLL